MFLELFVSMVTIGFFFIMPSEISSAKTTYSDINKPINELLVDTMPWVGLLLYKEHMNTKPAISGTIMITKKISVANAQDISRIDKRFIRNTTKAMFMSPEDHTWYSCQVIDYTLHSEFEQDTLNTVALVKLEYNEKNLKWNLLKWSYSTVSSFTEDIFAIGYTDRRGMLEQVVYRMNKVELCDCNQFYEDEQLDTKWMRPMQYSCYRTKASNQQCVFDAGMALVTNHTGSWILLGMSILGPGCSLPSRFIDLSTYAPWIEKTAKISRISRRIIEIRRSYDDDWRFEEFIDKDALFLERINEHSIVLKPVGADNAETVYGTCKGELSYREEINLEVTGGHESGFGVYELSRYDLKCPNLTCIKVTVKCTKISNLTVTWNLGFRQDDITSYMKTVPIIHRGDTNRPKLKYMKDFWTNYEQILVNTLLFKFAFVKKAVLKIQIYGMGEIAPVEPDYGADNYTTAP